MHVHVRLFGAFRNLGESEVVVALPRTPISTLEMKTLLTTHFESTPVKSGFNAGALVKKSALANDSAVLGEEEMIVAGARLALLPPVSGG